jgi:hypothetical protein
MTEQDLDLYLLMIQRRTIKSKVDARYHGGSDMRNTLEQYALKAINKHHNETPTIFERA